MRRKRDSLDAQPTLFDVALPRHGAERGRSVPSTKSDPPRKWHMPEVSGRTVAEIRVRWTKRLTPAQVARVEAELSTIPKVLTKLGFGTVQVEHAFVRRRKK